MKQNQKFSRFLLYSSFSFNIQDISIHWEVSCRVRPTTGFVFSSLFSLSSALAHLILWHSLMESACNEWLSFTRSPGSFAWLCPWAKQAGTMLGRATRNSARVKRLLKSEVIRASFTFKSVPIRMALLMLLSVTTYKTQHLQLVSEVPTKHLQTTDQHDLLFCTDPPCRKPEPFISCLLAYPPLSWPYFFFLVVFWNLWLWCAQNTPFNKCQEQIKEN